MAVKSGFFNAINNDRLYNALDMGQMFDGLIHDGVFATLGEHMIVSAKDGYRISVGTGKAWFDHTWTTVYPAYGITLEQADSVLNRIDAVVLETNNTDAVRRNMIKIVKGELAVNAVRPTLIRDDRINQYPLAWINIPKGATEIPQANITNAVGTSECPFVTAVNASVTMDELLMQWRSEFDLWSKAMSDEFRQWQIAEKQSFDDWERQVQNAFEIWKNNQQIDFENWWESIVDVITSISVGEFAVKFVELQDYVEEVDRHIDTHEDYAQTFYRTVDYEPHIVEPTGNTYGNFNDNVWLIPGIYVFADAAALKNTNHAPSNANYGGVLRVYDTSGTSVKDLTTKLPRVDQSFNVIQEFEYCGGAIPKVRRQITQTETSGVNVARTYSKWTFADEVVSLRNKNVLVSDWKSSGIDKYGYKATIPVVGIDANWYADVYFGTNDVLSGSFASFTDTVSGGVVIYSKKNVAVTVPLIICHQGAYLDTEVIK